MLTAPAARAQDRFEIQVYDSETAAPGDFGVEHHINVAAVGRTTVEDGELPTDRVLHLTFEPHIGLASWCEVGAYFQTAVRPEGAFDYAGVKLRYKARIPRRVRGVLGFALNLEVSSVPAAYEAAQLGAELRPIIDVKWKRLWASFNPIVAFDFRGDPPSFEPAAALMVSVGAGFSLGAEYYGVWTLPQVQRVFGILQWDWRWLTIHTGVGYGIVSDDTWIVKAIVGVDLGSVSR